jgi:hypothetical protein
MSGQVSLKFPVVNASVVPMIPDEGAWFSMLRENHLMELQEIKATILDIKGDLARDFTIKFLSTLFL